MSRGTAARLGAYACTWFIWGSTYLAIRLAVATLPPFLLVGMRSFVAGAILLAWARLRGHAAPTAAEWRAALAAGALFFLLGHGGLFWAEQRVTSGVAALMIATEHFWVVLITWALPGGRAPSRRAALGVALGLAGVGALSLGGGAQGGLNLLWTVVLLGASAAWAGGTVYFRGPRRPESPAYAAGMPLAAGGALLLALSAASGEMAGVRAADATPVAVAAWLYLTIPGSVIAFTAYTWLVQTDGPSRAGSYAYVNPFVAVLLGWLVVDEPLTARMLAAGVAITLAVVLIVSGSRDDAPARRLALAGADPRRAGAGRRPDSSPV